jgi:probable F420-dependent oxidoreductase
VKIDITLTSGLRDMAAAAAQAEADGYAGVWTFEGPHDPFLPLLLAAEHTDHIELGTSIAVAFARNPMLLANLGWDLQAYSQGRFILGLGTQIRPHITKRFSMPWSHPAARMRDMVLATRAIWDAWLTGGRLAHRGEFYTHTLMTPFFTPAAADLADFGPPRIFLAGVGALMTEVAGEVADGFLCHPLSSRRYLEEVTLPALARGRAKVGKTMEGFELQHVPFVLVGDTEEDLEAARVATRNQIAFYGSTPAYWPVL